MSSNTIKILSKEAKVHTIGYAYAGLHGTQTLSFRLLPGINEVNRDAWEAAKKLKVVAWYVSEGQFREVSTKAPGLTGLDRDAAIDMVKQTLDRSLLKEWKKGETRESVVNAIDMQIDEITYRPERDKPGAKDDELQAPRSAQTGLDGAEIAEQVQTEAPPPPLEIEDITAEVPPTMAEVHKREKAGFSAPKLTPPQRGKSKGKGK